MFCILSVFVCESVPPFEAVLKPSELLLAPGFWCFEAPPFALCCLLPRLLKLEWALARGLCVGDTKRLLPRRGGGGLYMNSIDESPGGGPSEAPMRSSGLAGENPFCICCFCYYSKVLIIGC